MCCLSLSRADLVELMPREDGILRVLHRNFGHHNRKKGAKALESVQRRDTGMEEQLRGLGLSSLEERRLRGGSWGLLQLPREGQL